jgi:hypothetical protein
VGEEAGKRGPIFDESTGEGEGEGGGLLGQLGKGKERSWAEESGEREMCPWAISKYFGD